jgi:cholesterol transport system auxiliary component
MNMMKFLKMTVVSRGRPVFRGAPLRTTAWRAPAVMIMAVGLFLAGLAGCVNLTRDSLPRQYYALNIETPPDPARVIMPGTVLKVRSFQEMPRYHGREFVYRRSNVLYQTDYYNLFLVSPGALLAEETGQWLAQCGPFERVVAVSSRVRDTHLLEGIVVLLEGDFRNAGAPNAVLCISMTLIDQTANPPAIVFQKHYARSAALTNTAPATLVEGWNKALQTVLTDFTRDLAATGNLLQGGLQKAPQGSTNPTPVMNPEP